MRAVLVAFVCLIAFPAMAKWGAPARPAALNPSCKFAYAGELKAARTISARTRWEVYPIEGGDVRRFLALFNAAEPKTDFKAEKILIAVNSDFAYVEMFSGGCMSNEGKLAPSAFNALMRQAFGGEVPNGTAI